MHNLQLVDSIEGGYFLFIRNDYPIDERIYSELYCAMFSTSSSSWWGDTAFDNDSYPVTSKTENALKTYNTNITSDINLLKKAVKDDLTRFQNKNPDIIIESVRINVYYNKALEIVIKLTGNNDTFNYIYSKTEESLTNIPYTYYDI